MVHVPADPDFCLNGFPPRVHGHEGHCLLLNVPAMWRSCPHLLGGPVSETPDSIVTVPATTRPTTGTRRHTTLLVRKTTHRQGSQGASVEPALWDPAYPLQVVSSSCFMALSHESRQHPRQADPLRTSVVPLGFPLLLSGTALQGITKRVCALWSKGSAFCTVPTFGFGVQQVNDM